MLDARIGLKRLPDGGMLLRAVRLTAGPGEIVALLGASGTGKTSTLRILLGLDRDFEGSVKCTARRVGALFQEPRLLPWRTVGDNIRLVIPRGRPMPDVALLLRGLGLAGSETLHPGQLSLGMARRVAVARSLAIEPDLLILDEPFASLDPSASGLVATCLLSLSRERRTTLVIAMHDIDRAVALATRVVVLAGRPATIACQADIAADASEADRAAVRAELMGMFPFLVDETPEDHGHRHGLSILPAEG